MRAARKCASPTSRRDSIDIERIFRPPQIIRRIEPLAGLPRIAIKVRPTCDYGRPVEEVAVGSQSHPLHRRRRSDAPDDGRAAVLCRRRDQLRLDPAGQSDLRTGRSVSQPRSTGRVGNSSSLPREHWREWVRHLGVPFEWQSAVIRAAITLKLCNYEETGAIVAAHHDVDPRSAEDAAHLGLSLLLVARRLLRRRGAESAAAPRTRWNPTSTISRPSPSRDGRTCSRCTASCRSPRSTRWSAPNLKGYLGHGPVRIGNQAADAIAARRLRQRRARRQANVRRRAVAENGRSRLCSASSRRLANGRENSRSSRTPAFGNIVGERGSTPIRRRCAGPPATASARSRAGSICRSARNIGRAARAPSQAGFSPTRGSEKRGAFTGALGQPDLDASVLLLARSRSASAPSDERFRRTCETIGRELMRNGRIMRYAVERRFRRAGDGVSRLQFLVHRTRSPPIGRRDEAREDVRVHSLAAAIRSGCCRRTFIPRPESFGAIFRKPIRWPGSSIRRPGCRRVGRRHGHAPDHRIEPCRPPRPGKKTMAGGLAVAVKAALRNRTGVWFGWSGDIGDEPAAAAALPPAQSRHLRRHRSLGRRFPGILQRLRQPGALADPALSRRSAGIFARRPERLHARQSSLRRPARRLHRGRRRHLGARLPPDAVGARTARARTASIRSASSCTFPARRRTSCRRCRITRTFSAASPITIWSAFRPRTTATISPTI